MTMLERDLLAAKCPVPATLYGADRLARTMHKAMGYRHHLLSRFRADNTSVPQPATQEAMDLIWSTLSVYQREEILVNYAVDILMANRPFRRTK